MSDCYKNFPVKIDYGDSTFDNIYGNDASLSENLNLEHSDSLGIKGANAVFNNSIPKGDISVTSYLVGDLDVFNKLKGSNSQNMRVHMGPYFCPAPCVMSSMSINISVDQPITVDRSFNYFGGVSKTSAPFPVETEINPIIAENVDLSGFDGLGGVENITSVSWSFSQSYSEHYLLGETSPIITFQRGQITLDVQGEGLTNPLTSASCVVPSRDYSITVSGCGGENLGTLYVTGYMQSRNSNVSSEQDESNSVSIIQYL